MYALYNQHDLQPEAGCRPRGFQINDFVGRSLSGRGMHTCTQARCRGRRPVAGSRSNGRRSSRSSGSPATFSADSSPRRPFPLPWARLRRSRSLSAFRIAAIMMSMPRLKSHDCSSHPAFQYDWCVERIRRRPEMQTRTKVSGNIASTSRTLQGCPSLPKRVRSKEGLPA